MRMTMLSLVTIAAGLVGCGDQVQSKPVTTLPPLVKTEPVAVSSAGMLGLSGIVRAQVESPLSFQVGGRITARKVDSGQLVKAGEVLFELDKRDLRQSVRAAQATLAAADSAQASAEADLSRQRQLLAKHFVSAQALEGAELAVREARTRKEVAQAHLQQAHNAFDYGQLRAPASGMLVDVSGEIGQVVAAGQPIALLAQSGAREVEVYFPEQVSPPEIGEIVQVNGSIALRLREKAGAVDPLGRTLRARYTITEKIDQLLLGAVVRTRFTDPTVSGVEFRVPLASISERGVGPRVWVFKEGQVNSVAVSVLALDADSAHIRGPLGVGDHIVVLGTHLLSEGMAARELTR